MTRAPSKTARIAELEAAVHTKSEMLDALCAAAGVKVGETINAAELIRRLRAQGAAGITGSRIPAVTPGGDARR